MMPIRLYSMFTWSVLQFCVLLNLTLLMKKAKHKVEKFVVVQQLLYYP